MRSIQRPSICTIAPVSLVAISPTLGDIVTVHSVQKPPHYIATASAAATTETSNSSVTSTSPSDCHEATETVVSNDEEDGDDEDNDDFVSVPIDLTGKSLIRVHTINAKYVGHMIDSDPIRACTYSSMKEGTGVNVIATGYAGGIVRLWSSWDLQLIKEIHMAAAKVDVCSLAFSTYQHLIVLTSDNIIQVWESSGLIGAAPKFPQIVFHKRRSV